MFLARGVALSFLSWFCFTVFSPLWLAGDGGWWSDVSAGFRRGSQRISCLVYGSCRLRYRLS